MPGQGVHGAYARAVSEAPDERASETPLHVAALLVTGGTLLSVGIHPYDPFGGHQLVDGLTMAAFAGAAALAFAHHRITRDPHALLVGAGLSILAAQTLLFASYAVAVGRPSSPAWGGLPFPSLGWAWAWMLAAGCFLFAHPWWDRRGRPPVRPSTVLIASAATLGGGDLVLVLARTSFGTVGGSALRMDGPFAHATWLHWILGAAALGLLATAAYRERAASRAPDPTHAVLGAAWIPAIGAQVLYLAWPVQFRPLLIPGAELPALTGALAFAGFLASGRAEASRMRRATDRAAKITGGRAEIASMIAHELRGPVTTVKGLATTGARHYESLGDPEKKEFFELIDQESRRLLHIVDQTSTALRVDAGTITYDVRPGDLVEAVREGAGKAEPGDHPVIVEAEPEINMLLDRLRIAQTVTQLVENAARFSPAADPIVIRSRRDAGLAVIEVQDRGPGIATEHRDRAFEKFTHIRPKGYEEVPGTGLGLFICRAHIMAHGGDISIEDPPQGGTMLRIGLPMEGNG